MVICLRPECQTTAGCKCSDAAAMGEVARALGRAADAEAKLEKLKVDLRAAIDRNRELRGALKTCIARAGVPDPVEACRLVIRTAEEALGN